MRRRIGRIGRYPTGATSFQNGTYVKFADATGNATKIRPNPQNAPNPLSHGKDGGPKSGAGGRQVIADLSGNQFSASPEMIPEIPQNDPCTRRCEEQREKRDIFHRGANRRSEV